MDKDVISADCRPLEPQTGAKLNDNTPDLAYETTLEKMATLLDATHAVEEVALASAFGRVPNIATESLTALTRSLAELRERLLGELPGGTVHQQVASA